MASEKADLLNTIILAESSGNPSAVGDHGAARGLCQIQRSTWERLSGWPFSDAFDPEKNVQVCMKRLEELRDKYPNKSDAYYAWKYNCGDHTKLSFEEWKRRQPNKAYRSLYKEEK